MADVNEDEVGHGDSNNNFPAVVDATTQTLKSNFTMMETPKAKSQPALANSPFSKLTDKLIHHIFEELDSDCTSVCFGLVCKEFYMVHRSIYPHPINLSITTYKANPFCLYVGENLPLNAILKNWIGDDYRFNVWPANKYLPKEVFGEEGSHQEKQVLRQRYPEKVALGMRGWAKKLSREMDLAMGLDIDDVGDNDDSQDDDY